MRSYEELVEAYYNGKVGIATQQVLADEIGDAQTGLLRCLYLTCRSFALGLKGEYAESIKIGNQALAEAKTLDDPGAIARALWTLALRYWTLGDYKESLDLSFRTLAVIEEHGLRGKASALSNLALIYSETGELEKSLEYYERAAVAERDISEKFLISNLGNIALCYLRAGKTERGIELLEEAITRATAAGDDHSLANFFGNLAFSHVLKDQTDIAQEYYRKAIDMATSLNLSREIGFYTTGLADVLYGSGRPDAAIALLDAEHEVIAQNTTPRLVDRRLRAKYSTDKGDLKGAMEILREALSEVEERGERVHVQSLCGQLRDLAKQTMDFEAYVTYSEKHAAVTADLNTLGIERKLAIKEKEAEFEEERRQRELERQQIMAERERERAVLYSTLPPSIADRVISGEQVTDHFDMATVIFLDIVGFTTISSTLDPSDVVNLLSSIFSTCDAILAKHGLMKIKTIGDSYMAVAFPRPSAAPRNDNSHLLSAANAALEMLHSVSQIPLPGGSPERSHVSVRIGVHCGAVTAGVIGTERLQYDVWGDTVNVASRMESTGEPGRVHVSEAFASFLGLRPRNDNSPPFINGDDSVIPSGSEEPGTWHLALRGDIEIKGKGLMTTYWLEASITM